MFQVRKERKSLRVEWGKGKITLFGSQRNIIYEKANEDEDDGKAGSCIEKEIPGFGLLFLGRARSSLFRMNKGHWK
jgi:hypothetical protein